MPPETKTIQIDLAAFHQRLETKLANLPSLPAVVARIMEAVNNPDASVEELTRLISMDPALAATVLRIVNSAYYGLPRRINTLNQAVMILGFTTVRNVVLGVSAFAMLRQQTIPYGLNRMQFWEHSVATAISGSLIAKRRLPRERTVADEAFIGGLLHDIGALFLNSHFPIQHAVAMAFATRERKTTRDAENVVLGVDHTTVGQCIGEHWNFPPNLVQTIGGHHQPMQNQDTPELVSICHAAEWIAWESGHKMSDHTRPGALDPAVEEWLGFDASTWESIRLEMAAQFKAADGLLQVASG